MKMPTRFSVGSIRKHGDKWQGIITVTDAGGRKRHKTKVFDIECTPSKGKGRGVRESQTGKGSKQAIAALAEWRAQLIEADARAEAEEADAMAHAAADMSVSQYVARYIEQRAKAGIIEPSTATDYRTTKRGCIDRGGEFAIKDIPLKELKAEHVRRWEAWLIADKPEGAGYSNNTAAKGHRLLKQALAQAVADETLDRNPMTGIRPPKRQAKRPNALSKHTAPQLMALMDALPNDTYVTIAARISLYTGMRRGEICALKWGDVDLDTGTALVKNSIGEADGGSYEKAPKTGKIRDVPLPAPLVSALKSWRAKQAQDCLAVGVTDMSAQYVIGTPGKYRAPGVLGKEWATLARQFGIKGTEGRLISFHDLRHTFATLAIAGGMDVKTVSSILGHANAAMTLNIYASPDPAAKRAAASTMENLLAPKQAGTVELPTGTDN